jgi:nucleoside-diphosphate-sugar epimerase
MSLKEKYSKVFLTGASGWLGSRIAEALTTGNKLITPLLETANCDVTCLVPAGENVTLLKKLGVKIITGDVTNPADVNQFLSESTGGLVLHIAGIIHPPSCTKWFDKINYEGSKNILTAATHHHTKRLVVMSSNSPLGVNPHSEHLFTEESPYSPYMGYGKSKHKMELMMRGAMQQSGSPEITIIRAPWFYGPGQPPRQTEFFKMIQKGKFPLMGKGLNKRSMAFIDSLAYGILLAADNDAAVNETFWIADERPYSMLEIINTVKAVLEKDFNVHCKKKNLHVPAIIADIAQMCDALLQKFGLYHQKIHVLSEMNKTIACDISKAKKVLGYQPLVDLHEGMRLSIQWCLEHNMPIT